MQSMSSSLRRRLRRDLLACNCNDAALHALNCWDISLPIDVQWLFSKIVMTAPEQLGPL
ncbi:hypothetical protein P4S53_06465 [Photobacterium sp. Hal280]